MLASSNFYSLYKTGITHSLFIQYSCLSPEFLLRTFEIIDQISLIVIKILDFEFSWLNFANNNFSLDFSMV